MVHIAIIDDGINEGRYNCGQLIHNIEITKELEIQKRIDYDPFSPSHGTTCAAIIKKYFPDAVLSSIKILDSDEKRGMKQQLVSALEWCMEKGIRLVNLSLGTIDYRDFPVIREAVNHAYKQGIIIVAACNNRNIYTCPASLTNVIGVKSDFDCSIDGNGYIFNDYTLDGIDITSYGVHRIVDHTGKSKETTLCNSFSAPYITAKVYEILNMHPEITLEEIKGILRAGSCNVLAGEYKGYFKSSLDWVQSAIVFNLSKSPVNTSNFVFQVEKVEEISCSSFVNGIGEIKEYMYANQSSLDGVDTVVVINDDRFSCSDDESFELASSMDSFGKNLVFLSNNRKEGELKLEIKNPGTKVWYPAGYLYSEKYLISAEDIDVPIIALYNLSENGMEEILFNISNYFKENGYNILTASNTALGAAMGAHYLPWDGKTAGILKELYVIYDADIIIYGLSNKEDLHEIQRGIGKGFEVDMNVLIIDKVMDDMYFELTNSEDTKIILYSQKQIDLKLKDELKGDFLNGKSPKELSEHILDSFDKVDK